MIKNKTLNFYLVKKSQSSNIQRGKEKVEKMEGKIKKNNDFHKISYKFKE